jgi:hypothetical protein
LSKVRACILFAYGISLYPSTGTTGTMYAQQLSQKMAVEREREREREEAFRIVSFKFEFAL